MGSSGFQTLGPLDARTSMCVQFQMLTGSNSLRFSPLLSTFDPSGPNPGAAAGGLWLGDASFNGTANPFNALNSYFMGRDLIVVSTTSLSTVTYSFGYGTCASYMAGGGVGSPVSFFSRTLTWPQPAALATSWVTVGFWASSGTASGMVITAAAGFYQPPSASPTTSPTSAPTRSTSSTPSATPSTTSTASVSPTQSPLFATGAWTEVALTGLGDAPCPPATAPNPSLGLICSSQSCTLQGRCITAGGRAVGSAASPPGLDITGGFCAEVSLRTSASDGHASSSFGVAVSPTGPTAALVTPWAGAYPGAVMGPAEGGPTLPGSTVFPYGVGTDGVRVVLMGTGSWVQGVTDLRGDPRARAGVYTITYGLGMCASVAAGGPLLAPVASASSPMSISQFAALRDVSLQFTISRPSNVSDRVSVYGLSTWVVVGHGDGSGLSTTLIIVVSTAAAATCVCGAWVASFREHYRRRPVRAGGTDWFELCCGRPPAVGVRAKGSTAVSWSPSASTSTCSAGCAGCVGCAGCAGCAGCVVCAVCAGCVVWASVLVNVGALLLGVM